MTNPTLTFVVGLPGSGKSTWAREYSEQTGSVIVESDVYREKLYGTEQGDSNKVFELVHKDVVDLLIHGKSVILDATNLSYKNRMALIQKVNSKVDNVNIVAEVFATQYEICIEQNKMRERQVPEYVISRMRESFTFPQKWEGFHDIVIHYNYDKNDYSIIDMIEEMNNFNQDNPHHTGTLGKHTNQVMKGVVAQGFDTSSKIYYAAFFHDVGKLYTKSYKDSKGNPVDFAHFYNHENVSAYEAMFYLLDIVKEKDIPEIVGLIQFHMRPYGLSTEKSKEKLINLIGVNRYDDLMILNQADREGK